ncbi:hypothetical protein HBI24_007520 [Parastagonospora nodorum]|nr:hypothetical protein HBI05_156160 [Parastagonospora nodorum]KAH4244067.1 hypothetical protein HBI06_004260 [Parastagonospora nodorum]KAH4801141.1 hypothetical protein HBH61_202070 [Parastagonospora nodorum]KAH5594538.1 hypothetical protein HBI24_007520 [Parastagonospora nodorum]KAH6383133.1 hypothetical protein HBI14_223600 [Parastagonospora nodorum]
MTQTTDEGQDETTAEWRIGAGVRVPSFNICDFAARRLALQGMFGVFNCPGQTRAVPHSIEKLHLI